jgi:hypothetical protein
MGPVREDRCMAQQSRWLAGIRRSGGSDTLFKPKVRQARSNCCTVGIGS